MTSNEKQVSPYRQAIANGILRRAFKVSLVVGTILMIINHGDAIVAGEVGVNRLIKILLTYCVPFLVSLYAGFSALKNKNETQ